MDGKLMLHGDAWVHFLSVDAIWDFQGLHFPTEPLDLLNSPDVVELEADVLEGH